MGNAGELQGVRGNSNTREADRGSVPPISSLGRALEEAGLYPEAVINYTIQAYEKGQTKAFEQDTGGGGVGALTVPGPWLHWELIPSPRQGRV